MPLSLIKNARPPQEFYEVGNRSSGGKHGVVMTKPQIVELMLDLVGYTTQEDLSARCLLEPSVGHGAFLLEAIKRLLASTPDLQESSILNCFYACDIDQENVNSTRESASQILKSHGFSSKVASRLVSSWVRCEDFLLSEPERQFDFVVGNPPYIRIEQLDERLQLLYRESFSTIFDRADLYVAFIEKALGLISSTGKMSYICADRWTLNKYGKKLRKYVTDRFGVEYYIDMKNESPFESEVSAYPSIFVFGPKTSQPTKVATLPDCNPETLRKVASKKRTKLVRSYKEWFSGEDPWVITSPEHLRTLRELEDRFCSLASYPGMRVGIGVATGCDSFYIVSNSADIEGELLLPLVKREDLAEGKISDAGRCVINTFKPEGGVIDLSMFPRFREYLRDSEARIKKRHVAEKNPKAWYRTIDRIYPDLTTEPKLLIPDIAGANAFVLDPGKYYPHHNLYFVTGSDWDLSALGAILSSKVSLFFIWSYATKMRGGYLRFQAQYLRKICVPNYSKLSSKLREGLSRAFKDRDFSSIDQLAMQAYGLDVLPAFEFVESRS